MTQQDDITQRVLTEADIDEIRQDWHCFFQSSTQGGVGVCIRDIERRVLSKLPAPVADERKPVAKLRFGGGGGMPSVLSWNSRPAGTYLVYDRPDDALASAPVAGEARMPPGYRVKVVEGHGYRITAPTGGDWVAHSDTPAGDLIAALLAAPQASEVVRWVVTDDMRAAVRFAPSSAHWSERLKEFFGPDAREGINALEKQLREARADLDRQQRASETVRVQALAALESAQRFIRNGVEFGYVRMPDADTPDPAHRTPGLIDAAIRALSAQPGAQKDCSCAACRPHRVEMRMILCEVCGDKRCPHAADHRNPCASMDAQKTGGSDAN